MADDIAFLIKVVQELSDRVDALEKRTEPEAIANAVSLQVWLGRNPVLRQVSEALKK